MTEEDEEDGVATPLVVFECLQIRYQTGALWIKVDIANQFKKVGLLFAENRLVTVLEKMSRALIFAIEIDGITGQQAAHGLSKGD